MVPRIQTTERSLEHASTWVVPLAAVVTVSDITVNGSCDEFFGEVFGTDTVKMTERFTTWLIQRGQACQECHPPIDLKRGDFVQLDYQPYLNGPEPGNTGLYVWDGTKICELDCDSISVGDSVVWPPVEFAFPEFPLRYFHGPNGIRNTPASDQSVRLNLDLLMNQLRLNVEWIVTAPETGVASTWFVHNDERYTIYDLDVVATSERDEQLKRFIQTLERHKKWSEYFCTDSLFLLTCDKPEVPTHERALYNFTAHCYFDATC